MTNQLAWRILVAMMLIALVSPSVLADDDKLSRATLKGIITVSVLVEDLPSGASKLGLTVETIYRDVELKLRSAGLRVITHAPTGTPYVYVQINMTDYSAATHIQVDLAQDMLIKRTLEDAVGVPTWSKGGVMSKPTAQGVRNMVRDLVESFLNAWNSVNPKK